MKNEKTWKEYNVAGATAPARPRLLQCLNRHFQDSPGRALDLGCGGGRDTRELLARGWRVDAVDNDETAIHQTSKLQSSFSHLSVIQSDFEALTLASDTYDLINASFSLPFCHPLKFQEFWKKIRASLRPGGIISGELFGCNDSWRSHPAHASTLTFLTRNEVENLLSGFIIEDLTEDESDGPTFAGPMKHWHLFVVVAKRPVLPVPGRMD